MAKFTRVLFISTIKLSSFFCLYGHKIMIQLKRVYVRHTVNYNKFTVTRLTFDMFHKADLLTHPF